MPDSSSRGKAVSAAAAALVGVISLLLTVLVVARTERLRGGLLLGVGILAGIHGLAFVIGHRAGAWDFAKLVTVWGATLALLPLSELAYYGVHAWRHASAQDAAVTSADLEARRAYAAVPRIRRDGLTLFEHASLPHFTINSDGFRGTEFHPRSAARIRIVLSGGSAVFGTGVADQATLPRAIERRLSADGTPVDVLNLGVEAVTFRTEVDNLRRFLPRLLPDLVVFHNGANDFLIEGWLPETGRPSTDLHRQDSLFTRLADRTQQSLVLGWFKRVMSAGPVPSTQGDAIVARAVKAYGTAREAAEGLCRESRVDCVFFLQPVVTDRTRPAYSERLEIETRESSFPGYGLISRQYVARVLAAFPDTTDLSAAVATDARVMFIDWVHLSGHGNDVLAAAIAPRLASRSR